MNSLQAMVNGSPAPLDGVSAHTNALDWLRGLGLTGCKEGCAEGECGACAVLVARPDQDGGTVWTAVDSCLVPAAALAGQEVLTCEGLAVADGLHPVQQEMAVRGGSQCGYCTPGFVCSMAAEYYRPDRRPPAEGRPNGHGAANGHGEVGPNGFDLQALSGNLCRCTGYRPIRDAAYAVGSPAADDPLARRRTRPAPAAVPTRLSAPDGDFVRPADLAEALRLLAERPEATVVAGSTDWGVEVNLKGVRRPLLVALDRIPELRAFAVTADHVDLGAALTLTEVEQRLAGQVPLLDQVFPQFASPLIRNLATLGGNIGTASPIGDTLAALLALEAVVVLASTKGERQVPLAEYFTGYRQTVRQDGELITTVRIPLPQARVTAFHKIAKRRFDDISSVAVGYALDVEDGAVIRVRIGLGGVAATPVRATRTEAALRGRAWTEATAAEAAEVMRGEGTPMDDQRASARYRAAMLAKSLLKVYAENQAPQEVRT